MYETGGPDSLHGFTGANIRSGATNAHYHHLWPHWDF